jgi:hypothetical protein
MKTLAKEFGTLRADKVGPNYSLNTGVSSEGWELISATSGVFANRTYFDLGGLSMEDKTLFFTGATMQDTLNPSANPSSPGQLAIMVDVMTNKPLSDADILAIPVFGNSSTGPVELTFDQTIYMRLRTWNIDLDNQAGGYFITLADNQLGSLSPTASDRIYCTRIVQFAPVNPDGIYAVWPVRYILQADAKEEPEFQYLMRLKRSYELQQRADRD